MSMSNFNADMKGMDTVFRDNCSVFWQEASHIVSEILQNDACQEEAPPTALVGYLPPWGQMIWGATEKKPLPKLTKITDNKENQQWTTWKHHNIEQSIRHEMGNSKIQDIND